MTMNQSHLTYLASPAWAEALRTELLPWLREAAELGDDILEIGPGPGLTTDLLLELAPRVTAVEVDPDLAAGLRERLRGTHAEIIHGSALDVDLPTARFSAATCFAMLHHMESPEAQDRLFARLHAALRPGATLLGTDSLDTPLIRKGHIDDTFTPVPPETLLTRLQSAGFTTPTLTLAGEHTFRFTATKPAT